LTGIYNNGLTDIQCLYKKRG